SLAFAQEMVFDCGTPDAAQPELGAQLVKFDGEAKGKIVIGDTELDAMVLPGLGTFTFLHIGDGFTIQYAVDPEQGFYDYSASGSKTGHKRGECSKAG
ncbi:MAG: hypothetical protein WBB85_09255, partial [Albidovulum sp.]|uniref:hypothetical protein n=1 Tax=Albidovulum sp. TaxID=1872424 RepID=UPI003CB25512